MPRKTNRIKSNTTILLVVEGDTEKIYFSELKTFERLPGVTVKPVKAKHSAPIYVLKQANKEYETKVYDSIWCIFDKDTFLTNEVSKELKKEIAKAENNNIKIADSFPAFEVWYLLHFQIPKKSYNNQNDLIKELKSFIKDYSKDVQWLENKNMYALLHTLQSKAIENSEKLNKENFESSMENKTVCNVHNVVKEILRYRGE